MWRIAALLWRACIVLLEPNTAAAASRLAGHSGGGGLLPAGGIRPHALLSTRGPGAVPGSGPAACVHRLWQHDAKASPCALAALMPMKLCMQCIIEECHERLLF